jgi:hypothetical protein
MLDSLILDFARPQLCNSFSIMKAASSAHNLCARSNVHLLILVAATLWLPSAAWSHPHLPSARRISPTNTHTSPSRRSVLGSLLQSCIVLPLVVLDTKPAQARNLPASTGADISQTGTVQTLVPIVALRQSLKVVQSQLATTTTQKLSLGSIPTNEQDLKRLFDAYSDPVSYKQKFLDQNAFLVYYSKGFDGPGRPSMEDSKDGGVVNERQTLQFGARNEAWIAWDNFLVELQFINDNDNDLDKYLQATIRAVDAYLSLAPNQDIQQAKELLLGTTGA